MSNQSNLKLEAWAEIVAEIKKQNEREPDELTLKEFCEMIGVSRRAGKDILKKLVEEGKVSIRKYRESQALFTLYKVVK